MGLGAPLVLGFYVTQTGGDVGMSVSSFQMTRGRMPAEIASLGEGSKRRVPGASGAVGIPGLIAETVFVGCFEGVSLQLMQRVGE